jgi:hypothetical protein
MPTVRSTYVNPLLTNISVAYKNDKLVADELFPTVVVDKETGLYFVADKENLRAPADARRAEFGRANRVSNTLSQAAYALEEKSLETAISDRVLRQYDDPFNPKANATNLVTEKLALDKEKDLQTTLLGSGATTIATASAWATASTDIAGQIRTGRTQIQKRTGQKANTLLIGAPALEGILKNTAFITQAQYTTFPDEETLKKLMARFFNVDRVIIAEAVENTAKEGQADSLDFIWSDVAILAYVAPNPALETPSAGYHLQLRDARYVDEWYEQEIKSTLVRANDFYDAKIVDANALYIFNDVM